MNREGKYLLEPKDIMSNYRDLMAIEELVILLQ